jgi:hypothetical protein
MSLELSVAIVAVIVSLVSFVINFRASQAADRHARMPIVIPQVYEMPGGALRVKVRNIGKGPAVNVVIADALGELATTDVRHVRLSRYKNKSHWGVPRHLERIPDGAELEYPWDSQSYQGALGLSYTDVLGSPYTLLTSKFGTRAANDAIIPHAPLNELKYPQET